jgi:hypothetical protein
MPGSFTYDVFLSHNSQDKPQVRKLAERLKKAGLRVWFDEWVIKAGDDIYLAIERGLEAARVQVLCLSPAALGSEWVTLERSSVLFRDPTNAGRRFVPLLLADCTLPDTLRRYKYVDFRQETHAAFDELLAACRSEEEAAPPAAQRGPKKKPGRRKPKSAKPAELAEPLAVLERKLTGHEGWVQSVAVSPDGKWAASGSNDQTVKIWDLDTGQCRVTLEGHRGGIPCVAISPDGTRLLSGSEDDTIRLWESRNWSALGIWTDHKNTVDYVCFSADSNSAFSVGNDDILRIWNVGQGTCLKRIDVAPEWYGSSVTHDGRWGLVGSRAGTLALWNLETGECLATLKGHSDQVNSVQIAPDGRFAVSGSDDQTVKIWDLEAKTCLGTLEGHSDSVMSVAISPDGALIASTGFEDQTVRSGIGCRGHAWR